MEKIYNVGAELEFYLFDNNGELVADLDTGKFPQKHYDVLPQFEEAVKGFCEALAVYKIRKESGPGQFEAEFPPNGNPEVLGKIVNEFKLIAGNTADKFGLQINFHPKPLEGHPGSSLHIHFSCDLFDPFGIVQNKGVVSPKIDPNNDYVRWAIGGLLAKMKDDFRVFVPNENGEKRLVDFMNAPTKICWGFNNRSVAVRIPDSKPKRVEHRVSGSDADAGNVIAAVVDAAYYGIENQIDPGDPVYGNAWEEKYEREKLL